jgi:hemoglobin-like flavoprotein
MKSPPVESRDAARSRFHEDPDSLRKVLERLAEHEARFTETFYELFFARRPDTLPLFGVHSVAEREEMIHETFRSLYALCEGEEWLDGNLAALGHSHEEYGVTPDMYDSYCDALIDCSHEILGDQLTETESAALRVAIAEVTRRMSPSSEVPGVQSKTAQNRGATPSG